MSPTTDVDALVQRIRRAAAELRAAGYLGLPAEIETIAGVLEAQRQTIDALRAAIEKAEGPKS